MKGELELKDTIFWIKRLEWLEEEAPSLLTTYLRYPGVLERHLNKLTTRAMTVVISMISERGMTQQEATEVALTEIIYPESQLLEEPQMELSSATQKKLKRFKQKHLNL